LVMPNESDSFVFAAASNQRSIIRRRLGLRVNDGNKIIDVEDSEGMTALRAAAKHGHDDIIRELALSGAHMDAAASTGETALHLAAEWGHTATQSLLVALGASVHSQDELLRTPLHLSVLNGHTVNSLLRHFPDPLLADYSGKTPEDLAREYGVSRAKIVTELMIYRTTVWTPYIRSLTHKILKRSSTWTLPFGSSGLECDILGLILDFVVERCEDQSGSQTIKQGA